MSLWPHRFRIMFAAVLAAFAVAAPAQTQSGGKDRFHKEAAPSRPVARFVQDFEPKPALWTLSDADTTIYLFGTIHMLPPELKWRSARLNAAIAKADELVVESSDSDFDRMDGRLAALLAEELEVDRPPLLDRVAPDKRAALAEAIETAGMPAGMFDRLPTWMAVFALAVGGASEDGATGEAGADSTLERLFVAAKKPVTSVEDPFTVIDAIRALPDAELLRLLEENPDAAETDTIEDIAWAKGDISKLEAGLTEKDLGAGMYRVLIRDRNRAWTGWLAERLKRPGTVLFAVGAGHLVGGDSLQTMLAARGLKTVRLD